MILSIDTYSSICGVALFDGNNLIAGFQERVPNRHSEVLLPMIDSALQKAGISVGDLTGVAVISGPGSFTGLRIGVSTAKGLCMGSDLPLISVGTFDAWGELVQELANEGKKTEIGILIDARQGDWYGSVFTKNGWEKPLCTDLQSWILQHPEVKTWVYESDQILTGHGKSWLNVYDRLHDHHLAEAAARIGFHRLKNGIIENLHEFEPVYIKDFIVRVPANPSLI